jgi:hypothetical protein
MQKIQPLPIWQNGIITNAEKIEIFINYDNLQTNAILGYKLFDEIDTQILDGVVIIAGEDYKNWDGSNGQAMQIVAKKLNIVFI